MLGDKIKKKRKELKINQDEIANMLNITRQSYSAYETNKHQPDLNTLKQICKILDISADYLLGIKITPNIEIKEKEHIPVEQFFTMSAVEVLEYYDELTYNKLKEKYFDENGKFKISWTDNVQKK